MSTDDKDIAGRAIGERKFVLEAIGSGGQDAVAWLLLALCYGCGHRR